MINDFMKFAKKVIYEVMVEAGQSPARKGVSKEAEESNGQMIIIQ